MYEHIDNIYAYIAVHICIHLYSIHAVFIYSNYAYKIQVDDSTRYKMYSTMYLYWSKMYKYYVVCMYDIHMLIYSHDMHMRI